MADLIQILPHLDTTPFAHILPSLERANITSNDLITLDAPDAARRAGVPAAEIRKLADTLIAQLHGQLGFGASKTNENGYGTKDTPSKKGNGHGTKDTPSRKETEWSSISTLDDELDMALNGGFPVGHVSEITGESAAGKTQLLLTLLLAVQLPPPRGLGKSALYLSTEAPLSTTRLHQILTNHPLLSSLPPSEAPSLSRVQSTQLRDVEAQDHVLRYQVPVQAERTDVGLIVLDSVAANFRAEFDRSGGASSSDALARRSGQLTQLGALLRHLAHTHNVAILVANQVLDRFAVAASAFDAVPTPTPLSQTSVTASVSNLNNTPAAPLPPPSQHPSELLSTNDPLSLDHQQRFFTGWGDVRFTRDLKTPSLGLTWTNQLSARIVLLREPILKPQDYLLGPGMDIVGWNRHMKVAFASWCQDGNGGDGIPFEVCEEGIRAKKFDKDAD